MGKKGHKCKTSFNFTVIQIVLIKNKKWMTKLF